MHSFVTPRATQTRHAVSGLLVCLACAVASSSNATGVDTQAMTEKSSYNVTLDASFVQPAYRPGETIMLTLRYTNHGTRDVPILVAFRTALGDHFDHLRIVVRGTLSKTPLTLVPTDSRESVEPVGCVVGPGVTLSHTLDLTQWLDRNGAKLMPGDYAVQAIYQTEAPTRAAVHPSLCAPLLDAPPLDDVEDGARLTCAPGPIRSTPIALRLVAD